MSIQFGCKNPSSKSMDVYKRYRTLYNTVLRTGKKLYYEKELKKNVSILKKTWELVKSATNTGCSMSAPLSKLIYDGVTYTYSYQIARKLNEFFTTMPQKITNEIPPCEDYILEDSSSVEGTGPTVYDS
jgi:hypothetical protein